MLHLPELQLNGMVKLKSKDFQIHCSMLSPEEQLFSHSQIKRIKYREPSPTILIATDKKFAMSSTLPAIASVSKIINSLSTLTMEKPKFMFFKAAQAFCLNRES